MAKKIVHNMDLARLSKEVPGTQSLARAAALLRVIATRNSLGLRLSELVVATGLEKPTARRLLQGLIREGFVRQAGSTRRYFLGFALFELGLAASPDFDIRGICAPSLKRIAAKTGDIAFLTMRSAFDSVCVDRYDGTYKIRSLTVEIGARRPLGSTVGGLALLAKLSDQEVEKIVLKNAKRLQRYGHLDASGLRRIVRRTRALGYALNSDDYIEGVSGVGIALRGRSNIPDLALSVVASSHRLDEARQKQIVEIMRVEADAIAKRLAAWRQPKRRGDGLSA